MTSSSAYYITLEERFRSYPDRMDPDPDEFPILSYVISNVETASINGNLPPARDPGSPVSPIERKLPSLADPRMLEWMKESISDVLQTRAVLKTLGGERPSKEAVEEAKRRVAEIDLKMSRDLSEVVMAPRPEGVERVRWRGMMGERESEIRRLAEEEKRIVKTVLQLDEMFGEYERVLGEVEERLMRVYEEGGLREEVVGILGNGSVLERVVICGRRLRYLPEAFGRIRGLVMMDLSNNLLEVRPCL